MTATRTLPEPRRLAYLQAMGVDSYFPRVALTGAPPSVLCEQAPVPEPVAESPAPARETVPDNARQTGGSPQALRDLLPPVAAARPAAGKRTHPAPAAPDVDSVRFTLRFFQLPGSTLLVDASPEAAPEVRLQQLAGNLLLAIARLDGGAGTDASDSAAVQQHVFRWPMVGNSQVAQSEHAAREAVTAAVQGNCERHGITRVLLMGELAVQYASTPVAGVRLLPCESLAHYLATPTAKAQLWRDLIDNKP